MKPDIIRQFQTASHIVFLTGAGVSTPSGIPDYRSKNGLYRKSKGKSRAKKYLSHEYLMHKPRRFYRFMKRYMYYPSAKPNVIHRVQAKLTRLGKASIITQNVDNLYNLAGADPKRLIEFHGNIYNCYCIKCRRKIKWPQYLQSPIHQTDGGLIRPDLVLYGEGIRPRNVARSFHIMLSADLIVIVGTAMKVEPFADLIKYHQPNVPIIAVNKQPLHFSYDAGLTMIQTDAVTFFQELASNLSITKNKIP